ncbi:DNA-3-methyladenine glycosylase 2 family protein [Clostridium sp. 19966]|uniref:DNA-3-methyladenine glycosylase family protein n=1 Tax=Clostridium sp. 19966 TaxID=2768166 RepID=UPI0028DE20D8|nr:DNA glycosylase [Clostridium sp. 19966]MDT8715491.1 DNA-3-methyladenine glycosylase 2 family protein [Clostridium sp. 19966]
MDYKGIEEKDSCVIVKEVKNFELPHVFDCGQCFRWNKVDENTYIGVAFERVIEVEKSGNDIIIHNSTKKDFYNIWEEYFDLKTDYTAIKERLKKDEILHQSVEFGHGIRLLKQDPFELVISFIISANNRIPMIKKEIENISRNWGKKLEYKGKEYYAFPKVEDLASREVNEFENCGVGFRAKYIKDTVEKIYNSKKIVDFEEYDVNKIKALEDDGCHEALQKFSGIGPKVADCIMLFSMQKYSAFPVDVWVKRAMMHFYVAPDVSLKKIRDFARNKFGKDAGFAQQYLFYYARENNIKVD